MKLPQITESGADVSRRVARSRRGGRILRAWVPARGRRLHPVTLPLLFALVISSAAVTLVSSRGAFSDTTDNSGNSFEAAAAFGSAALTGTLVPAGIEGDIVAGGETLIITLTNDTWDATVGADNAITTALINGIDSDGVEAAGWDAVVKAGLTFNDVTRTSDTVVTITLPAFAGYDITADETITVTVPATAVTGGNPIVATPTFQITATVPVAFTSVADTFADEDKPAENFGTDPEMNVKTRPTRNARSFVQFDISSIPAGSTINSATLTLCATDVPGATRTYDLHRVTASWVETTLSWDIQPAVAATITDSATTPAAPACMTWTVTADVQLWVDGTANNGWRVKDSGESGPNEEAIFDTRESGGQLPNLDVVYTP